jgi:hypothetical protein
MKIDENVVNKGTKLLDGKLYDHPSYPSWKSDDDLFSHQFSPFGRDGGFHLLRY